MIESLKTGFSGTDAASIDWTKTPDDVVEGVEAVFSAIKDADAEQAHLMEELFKKIEEIAELAGEAFELPILLGAAGAFAPFAAIGAGYMEAADKIKRDRSPIALAEGIAMGVMAETPEFIRDKFWMAEPAFNPAFEQGGVIEQYYNNGALALGYGLGKEMQGDNAQVFWRDLKRTDRPQLLEHGDPQADNWGASEWRSFYIDIASAFVGLHISE